MYNDTTSCLLYSDVFIAFYAADVACTMSPFLQVNFFNICMCFYLEVYCILVNIITKLKGSEDNQCCMKPRDGKDVTKRLSPGVIDRPYSNEA